MPLLRGSPLLFQACFAVLLLTTSMFAGDGVMYDSATGLEMASVGVAAISGTLTVIALGVVATAALAVAWSLGRKKRALARHMHALLQRADCMVWEARVTRSGDRHRWAFKPHPSGLFARLFSDLPPPDPGQLWPHLELEDMPEMDARANRALETGASAYQQEFRVRKGDTTLWLQEQVSIRSTAPGAWHLTGVVTDVTTWRQSEASMHAKEKQVHQILARADCLLWRATVVQDGDVLRWGAFEMPTSGLYPRLFGDRDPSAGSKLWSFLEVPALAEMNARARNALLGGASDYQQEFSAINSRETIWLREKVSITTDGPGRWHLVGVLTDVTAQHEAESALAAEKERLAVTLRAMADGVITTDIEGVVQFINHAAARLLGHGADSAVGRPITEVCTLFHTRTGAPLPIPVQSVALADAVVDLPPHAELRDNAGRRRMVEGCCAPIHAADSKVIGTVLVARDVTERERLEQELQRASKLESVGVLAGGIAHDFNNILTVIVGNINLAVLAGEDRSDVERALREAERAALQARDLTQQLLTFAKGGDPVRAAVHLPDILRQSAEFTTRGSRVRCEFDLAADLWPADADQGQISQVAQNLVLNAAQAMPTGGVIHVGAHNVTSPGDAPTSLAAGDYVHIAVTDTGVGIAPEYVSRIFDPFFTTKHQGSGLGLATVYSIVTRHRGLVDVDSQVGRGTTFHLWLPALRNAPTPTTPVRTPITAGLRGRVLVMDDEEPIRRLVGALLSRVGLTVTTVGDGNEAVERFRAAQNAGEPFDAVIMDLTVPGGMGGLEALEHLRAADPEIKAIVSSGYSSDPILANFRTHGFRGCVAKPYRSTELINVVRDVLAE